MRIPWWVPAGAGAVLFTAGVVSTAEGTSALSSVALPHEVQLARPGPGVRARPAPPLPRDARGTATVVQPSRPVVAQVAPSRAVGTGAPVSSSAVGAEPTRGGALGSPAPQQPLPAPDGLTEPAGTPGTTPGTAPVNTTLVTSPTTEPGESEGLPAGSTTTTAPNGRPPDE